MRGRFGDILLSILMAALGTWMVVGGLGIGEANALSQIDWDVTVVGIVFFAGGAWLFFRDTLAPGVQSMPVYRWVEFLLLESVLLILGFYFFISGTDAGDWNTALAGLVALVVVAWIAVKRFLGRGLKS